MSLTACNGKNDNPQKNDVESQSMLQGIWVDEDDESVAFMAKNDTLFYPESGVLPTPYRVYGDTIYIDGLTKAQYYIEKLSSNVLQFRNHNGELVKLVKSQSSDDLYAFGREEEQVSEINQELIKRDTVVFAGEKRYHCYVQVNPTTYQVVKKDINEEGVSVGKVYYDNIINLTVYEGSARLVSYDYKKQDFSAFVPKEIMSQSILSDITFDRAEGGDMVFLSYMRIPESASSYVVEIHVSPAGKRTLVQPK